MNKMGLDEIYNLIIDSMSDHALKSAGAGVSRLYNRYNVIPLIKYCVNGEYQIDGIYPVHLDNGLHNMKIFCVYGIGEVDSPIQITCNPCTGQEVYFIFPDAIPHNDRLDDVAFMGIMDIYRGLSSYYSLCHWKTTSVKNFKKQMILYSIATLYFFKDVLGLKKLEKFNHYQNYPYKEVFEYIDKNGIMEFKERIATDTDVFNEFFGSLKVTISYPELI